MFCISFAYVCKRVICMFQNDIYFYELSNLNRTRTFIQANNIFKIFILFKVALNTAISGPSKCPYYRTSTLICKSSERVEFDAWLHSWNGVVLQRIKGNNTHNRSSIEIRLCGYQDSGMYTCRMTDVTGQATVVTADLTVQGIQHKH